jgi:ABC-type branched-subunit amino acid transport system substrate-binding protein
MLTKSYGVTHESGRTHPPYTERALELAITRGLDPAGNRLSETMPRYWISRDDLSDLVAYLKKLGADRDAGLAEDRIVIGTVIPGRGPLVEMGKASEAMLRAYFQELNDRGGIYNRMIELRVMQVNDSRKISDALAEFVANEPIFAAVAPFTGAEDQKFSAFFEQNEIPAIGAMTSEPRESPVNRYVFYLFSGLEQQARALSAFAAAKLGKQLRIAIVGPDERETVIKTAKEEFGKLGVESSRLTRYAHQSFEAPRLIKQMAGSKTDAILFLGPSSEAAALLEEARKQDYAPMFLVPGSLADRELLESAAASCAKVHLALPTLPWDQKREQVAEYRALAEKYNLSSSHVAPQLSAYCAARVIVEALRLSGRNASRETLLKTLEGFYQFQTGLSPPISFGPNRRIGALGAYIVSIDPATKQFVAKDQWISVE